MSKSDVLSELDASLAAAAQAQEQERKAAASLESARLDYELAKMNLDISRQHLEADMKRVSQVAGVILDQ